MIVGGLTSSQAAALDREGFLLVADALDGAWTRELLRAFEAAPLQTDGTQHVQLAPETPGQEAWARLREHPIARAVAGHVMEGARSEVSELHGRNPLPGFGLQGLHADAPPRAEVRPFVVVTAIWMLDAFTEENGATRVVPGSHLSRAPIGKELAQPAARHPRERIIVGPAGSVLLFNGHLWHAGRRNESRGPRRAGQMIIRRAPPAPGVR